MHRSVIRQRKERTVTNLTRRCFCTRVRPSACPEDACDKLVATGIVIQEVSRQADGRIRDSVQCLRPQAHWNP